MISFFSNVAHAIKTPIIHAAGAMSSILPHNSYYLSSHPSSLRVFSTDELDAIFAGLPQTKRENAFKIRWEMAKMTDPRIQGLTWGEDNFWKDLKAATQALHRTGALGPEGLHQIQYNTRILGGENSGNTIYYSLSEKLGNEPAHGFIGYINGMGTRLEQAGADAAKLSNNFASGHNIHCVYLPTRQNSPSGDITGFILDAARHIAADGGAHTRASCLLAQQWIDKLDNTNATFLQICHSEGASHVNAALRLLRLARPDLLSQLRIISIAPAHIIIPNQEEQVQVMNFIKLEDTVVNPWGTKANEIRKSHPNITVVIHTPNQCHPHNPISEDFRIVLEPIINGFLKTGNLPSINHEVVIDVNDSNQSSTFNM